MVKNLPLLRGARRILFSKAVIAVPASCYSYCILSRTVEPILDRSFPQRSGAQFSESKSGVINL